MLDVVLKFQTGGEERTAEITDYRTTLGRSSDATCSFDDQGASRVNSSIYREGDQIWIVDEGSTNGTFVNGRPAAASGTVLKDGDVIKIGNSTSITVTVTDPAKAAAKNAAASAPAASTPTTQVAASNSGGGFGFLPIAMIGFAVVVIGVAAVFIGVQVFGRDDRLRVVRDENLSDDDSPIAQSSATPTPKNGSNIKTDGGNSDTFGGNENLPINDGGTTLPPPPPAKAYASMTDAEKDAYVAEHAMRIAQVIGNSSSDKIPANAIKRIRADVDAYARRINVKPRGGTGCKVGDNLQITYERASRNAPFIIRAFNAKGIDPRVGLYLAMIESEHCNCLQSPTGPLGMFQFTYSTAMGHFEPNTGIVRSASETSPDDRCKPEPAARAAASYMKALTGRYGTGPSSVPLAIGSYNSGEGGLSSNLVKALSANQGLRREFWSLVANAELLSKQFQTENFKYVPKFFAAAIIGEDPTTFGLKLQPISTYSK